MTLAPLRIGFATVYSWRPHVEHAYFLAQLAERAGHEAFFLTCDADLPTCYTREMRDRPAWRECLECRAGGLRSYTSRNLSSIGANALRDAAVAPIEWAQSSASTLGRFESDADYASAEFQAILTTPQDRVAIIATAPLTAGEAWQALAPGEMRVLVGGRTVAAGPCTG